MHGIAGISNAYADIFKSKKDVFVCKAIALNHLSLSLCFTHTDTHTSSKHQQNLSGVGMSSDLESSAGQFQCLKQKSM